MKRFWCPLRGGLPRGALEGVFRLKPGAVCRSPQHPQAAGEENLRRWLVLGCALRGLWKGQHLSGFSLPGCGVQVVQLRRHGNRSLCSASILCGVERRPGCRRFVPWLPLSQIIKYFVDTSAWWLPSSLARGGAPPPSPSQKHPCLCRVAGRDDGQECVCVCVCPGVLDC